MKDKKEKVSLKVAIFTGLIAILIYVIVLDIFRDTITAELTLSYFGTMLTAIVTIFGVMWQIEKNNEKIDEERKESEKKALLSVYKYFYFIINENISKYKSFDRDMDPEMFYNFYILKKIDKGNDVCLYNFDNELIINHFDTLALGEVQESIMSLKNNIDRFNIQIEEKMPSPNYEEVSRFIADEAMKYPDNSSERLFLTLIHIELCIIRLNSGFNSNLKENVLNIFEKLNMSESIIRDYMELSALREKKNFAQRLNVFSEGHKFIINFKQEYLEKSNSKRLTFEINNKIDDLILNEALYIVEIETNFRLISDEIFKNRRIIEEKMKQIERRI